ncbi:MAG: hypothetical protein WDZ63_13295 [Burkholderiales bacterium]
MHKLIVLAVVAFAVGGCVTPQKVNISSSFDAAQASQMLEKGSNSLRGSALIRQRGGGVVTCAGQDVVLAPATAYASERVKAIYGSEDGGFNPVFGGRRVSFESEPPEFKTLILTTRCDAQGYFKFDQVANGSFYVVTLITWKVSDYVTEGGHLCQRITLNGGESKEIVLSP